MTVAQKAEQSSLQRRKFSIFVSPNRRFGDTGAS
jgi:hypothetical protein